MAGAGRRADDDIGLRFCRKRFNAINNIFTGNVMASQQPLRILLVGNGGREHTLAWKLSQSPLVETIHVVPGNGGTAR